MGYSSSAFRMPFGRYQGQSLEVVPSGYLEWLASRPDLRPPLRGHVFAELARRRAHVDAEPLMARPSAAPAMVDELIEQGFRSLARRHHPDVGGTHEGMLAVVEARDWLREQVGAL